MSPLNQSMVGVAVDLAGNVYFSEAGRIRVLASTGMCGPSARPLSTQAQAAGGNLTIGIQADAACPWLVGSLPEWLTAASAASVGQGFSSLTLFATGTNSPRSATIFVAGALIGVNQMGGAAPAFIGAVTNAGSYRGGPVAQGESVVIYGSGLGPGQLVAAPVISIGLAGTQVYFNGLPAPVIYTSSNQVAAIVPYGVFGAAKVAVTSSSSQSFAVALIATTAAAPGVLTSNASGTGQAAAINQDGSLNSAANPAHMRDYISLFVTGEGQTFPEGSDGKTGVDPLPQPLLPVGVTIGGKAASVSYAGGAPGLVAGVMQINAMIPAGIETGTAVPLLIQVGGVASQSSVTVAVVN